MNSHSHNCCVYFLLERRHILTVVLLALLVSCADAKVHRASLLENLENLELFFGPSGCIEGLFLFQGFKVNNDDIYINIMPQSKYLSMAS